MVRILAIFFLTQLLLACALFEASEQTVDYSNQTLSNVKVVGVNTAPNSDHDITHDQVMEKYKAYI